MFESERGRLAFVERFIQTLQQECLDYFVVSGERHMDHLVSEMLTHYHEERPHPGAGQRSLAPAPNKPKKAKQKKGQSPHDVAPITDRLPPAVRRLLKHCYRLAA
jgi:hypothetical protein